MTDSSGPWHINHVMKGFDVAREIRAGYGDEESYGPFSQEEANNLLRLLQQRDRLRTTLLKMVDEIGSELPYFFGYDEWVEQIQPVIQEFNSEYSLPHI